ncbi:MAG: hemolysin family protein [Acidobacteriota bacterium]|jgi:CBS domain containing-hemolysin-like protein
MGIGAIVVVVLLLIGANAFYVGTEFAVVSARRGRIRQLAQEGRLGARLLVPVLSDNRNLYRALTACQVGITASSLALGAFAQVRIADLLRPWLAAIGGAAGMIAESAAVVVTLLSVALLQVVFGEMVPKSIALRHPLPWSLMAALPLRWSQTLFTWFIVVLTSSANGILRLLGVPAVTHRGPRSAAELGLVVAESARVGAVSPELRDGVHNALRFSSRTARDVMVPRIRVRGIPVEADLDEVRRILRESQATRLPVYHRSLDEIVGFVHAKEVLVRTVGAADPPPLDKMVRAVLPVPWSARAGALLEKMRSARITMAVVLDEHGGTEGIVTLEDLVQEVIGEVEEEFAITGPRAERLPDGRMRLRGEDPLVEIRDRFGLDLRSEEAHTLGGLIMERLGRIGRPGDRVHIDGITLEIEAMNRLRIETVMATPAPAEEGGVP